MEKVVITCEYKNGLTGVLILRDIDKESGRPYAWINLGAGNRNEIFFEGEYELI